MAYNMDRLEELGRGESPAPPPFSAEKAGSRYRLDRLRELTEKVKILVQTSSFSPRGWSRTKNCKFEKRKS